MIKYSRRHHRAAKKEVAYTPRMQAVKIRKNKWKIILGAAIVLFVVYIESFTLGYFIGKSRGRKAQ